MVFSYDDQDMMLSYGDNSYTYTANGDLMVKTGVEGTTTYDYDATGNLNSVILPDKTVSYAYDGMNRRIAKAVDGVVTERFIYLSQLKPFAKVNSDGSIAETYIYGTKVNIPEYVIRDGNTYRVITDHLGSLRLVIDSTDGTVKQRMSFDEFGTATEDYIESGFEPLPFGYAGGLYDRDTKLVTFGVREYDSGIGRWLEKEPLGFRGAMNFYSYAGNDPINFVDRNGLWKSEGHNDITFDAAIQLRISIDDIRKLQEANVNVDKVISTLFSDAAHFMPDDFTFSDEEDFLAAMDIISSRLKEAMDCEKAGYHNTAMELLGQGLHTLQDYFSHFASNGGWMAHIEGNPDSPEKNATAYQDAIDFSKAYIEAFLEGTK